MLSTEQERRLQEIRAYMEQFAYLPQADARALCEMIETLKTDNRNLHLALKRCMEMERKEDRP